MNGGSAKQMPQKIVRSLFLIKYRTTMDCRIQHLDLNQQRVVDSNQRAFRSLSKKVCLSWVQLLQDLNRRATHTPNKVSNRVQLKSNHRLNPKWLTSVWRRAWEYNFSLTSCPDLSSLRNQTALSPSKCHNLTTRTWMAVKALHSIMVSTSSEKGENHFNKLN